jgi:hypothetical protein
MYFRTLAHDIDFLAIAIVLVCKKHLVYIMYLFFFVDETVAAMPFDLYRWDSP